jgi:hypothetical protein
LLVYFTLIQTLENPPSFVSIRRSFTDQITLDDIGDCIMYQFWQIR